MNKSMFASKTVWGGILLAIEAGLLTIDPTLFPWVQTIITVVGTFLTIFGFRDAMK